MAMGSNPIDRRFDYLRGQQQQQNIQQQQQASEDINRKAASQGRLGSGVTQKMQDQTGQQLTNQGNQALEGIETQREGAHYQEDQAQKQRDFEANQAGLGREFTAQQNQLGRQFATSERLGSQDFAAGEAAKQRGFQSDQFNQNMDWQKQMFGEQSKQWEQQFNESIRQYNNNDITQTKEFNRQMNLDELNSQFNMDMANKQFNKPELMDSFYRLRGVDPKSGQETGGGIYGLGKAFSQPTSGFGSGGNHGGGWTA